MISENRIQLFIWIVLIGLAMAGCNGHETPVYRLNQFYSLIEDREILQAFEKGDLEVVSTYLEKKTGEDKDFGKKYKAIKTQEGIDYHSPPQFVYFFYDRFYLKLNPSKK